MSHTPGPWSIYETAGNGGNIPARMEVVAPESERAKKLIANIYGFKLPEGRANARLIAAAPELYEALEAAYLVLTSQKTRLEEHADAVTLARAALAKVRADEGKENA